MKPIIQRASAHADVVDLQQRLAPVSGVLYLIIALLGITVRPQAAGRTSSRDFAAAMGGGAR